MSNQIKYNMGIKGVSVFQVDPVGSLIEMVVLDCWGIMLNIVRPKSHMVFVLLFLFIKCLVLTNAFES